MSTTFDVYPGNDAVPAFEAVLLRAEAYLDRYLRETGILVHLDVRASIRSGEPDAELTANVTGPMEWDDGSYAWFTVDGFRGGADAYYWPRNSVVTREYLEESLVPRRPELARTLDVGRHWSIRRSANELVVVKLASGFVAAAMAELTDGFLFSDDGAWTFESVAKTAAEFVQKFGLSDDFVVVLKEELLGDE